MPSLPQAILAKEGLGMGAKKLVNYTAVGAQANLASDGAALCPGA